MPRNNRKPAPPHVRAIRDHLKRRKCRAKRQGKPLPTYDHIEQVFREAGVCPTDKTYLLETDRLTDELYLVKKRKHMSPEELRLHVYITDKKINCRQKGVGFLLTPQQVQDKLTEAGITIFDVGKGTKSTCGRDFYQLCRVNDEGPYDMTSSFKTQQENIAERDTTNIGKGPRNKKGLFA